MNKSNAYKILTDELEKIRSIGISDAKKVVSQSQEYVVRGESGTAYNITIKLVGNKLEGSISELNSFKFELLEESIEILD